MVIANSMSLWFSVFQKQTLMQHVLRCDYEACRQYLVNLEQAFMLDQGSQTVGALLDHRCDGNRNILHAAVSVCFPVSNKETKEEEGAVTFKTMMRAYQRCLSVMIKYWVKPLENCNI